MPRCCAKFEEELGHANHKGISKQEDGYVLRARDTYGITRYISIEFCPFCGKELEPRFKIQRSHTLGWLVKDKGQIVAYFKHQGDAQDHMRCLS